MVNDPIRDLLDLGAVHAFYIKVLEEAVGHAVPLPYMRRGAGGTDGGQNSVDNMRQWLDVLDLALSPTMMRDALKAQVQYETAEALLRFFTGKSKHAGTDGDKADFVATFLFRNPWQGLTYASVPPDAEDTYFWAKKSVSQFDAELRRILADTAFPEMPHEHVQLLREFEHLHQEIADFRTFDQLMDSGIIQRVRDIKRSFAASFYHPSVLAECSVYNVVFGERFDELFRDAARQIKTFAESVQRSGASILTRVEGDVTVKNITEVDEDQIMGQDYGLAQEQFRKVSRFKKAVDTRRPRAGGAPVPPASAFQQPASAPAPAMPVNAELATGSSNSGVPENGGPRVDVKLEESKIENLKDVIRNFSRAADPRQPAQVVPLRNCTIGLYPQEFEAYRSDYHGEKSFRADFAAAFIHLVAVHARMAMELEDFKGKQRSAYLWKPHADALTYLLSEGDSCLQLAGKLVELCQQRGLTDKANGMKLTIEKLQKQAQQVAKGLQQVGGVQAQAQTI